MVSQLLKEEAIELYERILAKQEPRFPLYFWSGEEGLELAAILVRYMLDKEGIQPTEVTKETLYKFKLRTVLTVCNDSPYAVIDNAYPGIYKPWELVHAPAGYWTAEGWRERAAEATKWMIEDRLGWSIGEIPERLEYDTFHQNCLGGMINNAFDENIYYAVDNAYPGLFKPWEFRKAKLDWSIELASEAIRWFVTDKLRISPKEAVRQVTYDQIIKNNLITAYRVLGSNMRSLIRRAFPEEAL